MKFCLFKGIKYLEPLYPLRSLSISSSGVDSMIACTSDLSSFSLESWEESNNVLLRARQAYNNW